MSYYIRVFPTLHGTSSEAWEIGEGFATRLGFTNDSHHLGLTNFQALPGEDIWEKLRRDVSGWFLDDPNGGFHLAPLKPGEYYPRMARPIDQHPSESPGMSPGAQGESEVIAISISQLVVLTRQLNRICQTIHPTEKTYDTYGHDVRNLLILACTEVETHWRGVLVANGADVEKRFSTNRYVQLADVMRLREYEVRFPNFPWLAPICPFAGWDKQNPTGSLAWYDAYNSVKHDRELEFSRATLRHAFEAVTACAVLLVAQFGLEYLDEWKRSELNAFFHCSERPKWGLTEVYIYPYAEIFGQSGKWSPLKHGFS